MLLLKNAMMIVQFLSALCIIVLVLLQHGKGADMGAAFGGGASGSLFGASGAASFLSRTTAVLAAIFFASTLALTFIGSDRSGVGVLGKPVTQPAPSSSSTAPDKALPATPADDIPK
jgi:preprotein translocase subunit SecG